MKNSSSPFTSPSPSPLPFPYPLSSLFPIPISSRLSFSLSFIFLFLLTHSFIIFSTSEAWSNHRIVLKISDKSVQLSTKDPFTQADPSDLRLTPRKRIENILLNPQIPLIQVGIRMEEGSYRISFDWLEKHRDQINNKYPQKIASLIEEIARSLETTEVRDEGGFENYYIEDGIEFFYILHKRVREISKSDPLFSSLVETLFEGIVRKQFIASPLEKMIAELSDQLTVQTYILSADDYSREDIDKLIFISRGASFRAEKIGNHWVLGSGTSYFLALDTLKQGLLIQNHELKLKWAEILAHFSTTLLPIQKSWHQGAAAYFDPTKRVMAYTLPGFTDLDTTSHEVTHSRFNDFLKVYKQWLTTFDYAIPYEINGPPLDGYAGLFAEFGGIMNLLNEVSSWVIGSSFLDHKTTLDGIYNILVSSYGQQAGYTAVEAFQLIWRPEMFEHHSVYSWILSITRSLNNMTNNELVDMGFEGVETGNIVLINNFLIMYKHRRFNENPKTSEDVRYLLLRISNEYSTNQFVLPLLKSIDSTAFAGPTTSATADEASKTGPPTEASSAIKEAVEKKPIDVFIATGSEEAFKASLNQLEVITPTHVKLLFLRSMKTKDGPFNNLSLEILEKLMTYLKIPPPVGPRETRRNRNFKNRAAHKIVNTVNENSESSQVRNPIQDSQLISAIDDFLSQHLYDGTSKTRRMDTLNFIAFHFHPLELPKTLKASTDLLYNYKTSNESDRWVARLFFMPANYDFGKSMLWGDELIRQLQNRALSEGENLPPSLSSAFSTYYEESLGKYFPDGSWGTYKENFKSWDEKRNNLNRSRNNLSSYDATLLKEASRNLWEMMGSEVPAVRKSAQYAAISNLFYLIEMEGYMIQELLNTQNQDRLEVVQSIISNFPKFLPKASKIFFHQMKKRIENRDRVKSFEEEPTPVKFIKTDKVTQINLEKESSRRSCNVIISGS